MGQKVNPISLRVGINKISDSTWYAEKKNFANNLIEDFKIRTYLKKNFANSGISKISIERVAGKVIVNIHTSKPGVLIGKKGADIEKIKNQLTKISTATVHVNVSEIRKPELDANLVAQSIAMQLEKRVSFRRAMKRPMQTAMRLGALGIRVNCSGRLGGAEIARTEWYREGRVPLHTFRADIDYGFAEANTTYGVIGIKVWLYKGELTK